ncbi:hypothetical protein PG989_008503 [Apiospora arundinis]
MYSPTPPPPIPPPKPGSHDTSRLGTPATNQSPRPPPNPDSMLDGKGRSFTTDSAGLIPAARQIPPPEEIPDPGEQWLPRFLEDKSKQDLADILSDPNLLNALTHAPDAGHPLPPVFARRSAIRPDGEHDAGGAPGGPRRACLSAARAHPSSTTLDARVGATMAAEASRDGCGAVIIRARGSVRPPDPGARGAGADLRRTRGELPGRRPRGPATLVVVL